jgi:hypothetical protein
MDPKIGNQDASSDSVHNGDNWETSEIVCTLFEGAYGIGVAALVNSLVAAGYTGKVYVGFRGALPAWATDVQKRGGCIDGSGSKLLLQLVPLSTTKALANYKPEFMLYVMEALEPHAAGIIYFDPDITVRCQWTFFKQWLEFGLIVCEDVNSPIHQTHPRRLMWRRFFSDLLKAKAFQVSNAYINSGFVGLSRQELRFLRTWSSIVERASSVAGGLTTWLGHHPREPSSPFSALDQDALNVAIMATNIPISVIGPEGMDFRPGGYVMSHAIGPAKPWDGKFLRRALAGRAPSTADRSFVKHVGAGPLKPVNDLHLALMRLDLLMAKIASKLIH